MYNGLYFLWQWQSLFSWVSKSLLMVTTAMKLKDASPWKKSYDKPRQRNEKKRCYFAGKGLYSQSNGFSNSHVQMWELDHKEGWALKNWCFRTVVLGFPCGSVWSVGWEDPLEKGKATHSSFLAWRIPGLYSPWGCKKSDTTEQLSLSHASPLDCREYERVNPKGNQSEIFIGRTDDEAEAPTLWPPDVKIWLIRKDPDAGKDWRQG